MIPRGRVATDGQVATQGGMPPHARRVGRTHSPVPSGSKLPRHRVINATLRKSRPKDGAGDRRQRSRLEAEGVEFVGDRVVRGRRWDAGA
jgi:methylated-DNA-protein-cysteine methyltransferase-like protein